MEEIIWKPFLFGYPVAHIIGDMYDLSRDKDAIIFLLELLKTL